MDSKTNTNTNTTINYKLKYLKYKNKYLELKNLFEKSKFGGAGTNEIDQIDLIEVKTYNSLELESYDSESDKTFLYNQKIHGVTK